MAIDPIQLPLPDVDPDRLYTAPEDFVLFNGIRDAAPDGWGGILWTAPLARGLYQSSTT